MEGSSGSEKMELGPGPAPVEETRKKVAGDYIEGGWQAEEAGVKRSGAGVERDKKTMCGDGANMNGEILKSDV
jgi:hypothetical protein